MSKFTKVVEEKRVEYGVVLEDMGANNGGAIASGQMDANNATATMDQPQMDASPNPETGAEGAEPVYDKPYQDLAAILYQALRTNFEDLEQTAQRKILALHPEDIKSDQQGVSLFKALERILDEREGPQPEPGGEGEFGPGA